MSLIDLFKGFHGKAIQQEFPPSARVLFDTVVFKLNEAYWPNNLVFSERDLIQLTGLKKTTLHEAKHFLTSRHLLECKAFKNKTSYALGSEMRQILATTNRPPTDRSATASGASIIRPHEDVKTEDLSSKDERAREFEELLGYWGSVGGGRLSFEHQSELWSLVEKRGVEWVKSAMREASDTNGSRFGVNMKLLRAVIERKAKSKPKVDLKGVEAHEYTKPPEYDFLDEWDRDRGRQNSQGR